MNRYEFNVKGHKYGMHVAEDEDDPNSSQEEEEERYLIDELDDQTFELDDQTFELDEYYSEHTHGLDDKKGKKEYPKITIGFLILNLTRGDILSILYCLIMVLYIIFHILL